jgi:D-arabinose 1-dehydrogenase-like Zn-dependent alcohol dehydrogenase
LFITPLYTPTNGLLRLTDRWSAYTWSTGLLATPARFDIFEAIRRATTVHVAMAGSRAGFEMMARAMELHALRPTIAREFPVDQIAAAFDCLQQGGHFGKIALRF